MHIHINRNYLKEKFPANNVKALKKTRENAEKLLKKTKTHHLFKFLMHMLIFVYTRLAVRNLRICANPMGKKIVSSQFLMLSKVFFEYIPNPTINCME